MAVGDGVPLVFGTMVVLLVGMFGLTAILSGIIALTKIRASQGAVRGAAMAWAGLILGIVSTGILLLLVLMPML